MSKDEDGPAWSQVWRGVDAHLNAIDCTVLSCDSGIRRWKGEFGHKGAANLVGIAFLALFKAAFKLRAKSELVFELERRISARYPRSSRENGEKFEVAIREWCCSERTSSHGFASPSAP